MSTDGGADLHTLTGAYALHATTGTERTAFTRHLTECVSCTQEVRELRATAARLGLTTTASPPPHLRNAILQRVRQVRQHKAGTPRHRAAATSARLAMPAAAVLLVVAATLSTILHAEDSRLAHHDGMTIAVSHVENRGFLVVDLPPAPAGHTYQVWLVDTRFRSAGTLHDHGRTTLELTAINAANRIAITVEPDGGSTLPTTEPITETAIP